MSDCLHLEFISGVRIARMHPEGEPENITGYHADVKIFCKACGLPFEFVGVPGGFDFRKPTVNFDGTELRAPLRPTGDAAAQAQAIADKAQGDFMAPAIVRQLMDLPPQELDRLVLSLLSRLDPTRTHKIIDTLIGEKTKNPDALDVRTTATPRTMLQASPGAQETYLDRLHITLSWDPARAKEADPLASPALYELLARLQNDEGSLRDGLLVALRDFYEREPNIMHVKQGPYVNVQDDDCHWYYIPENLKADFYEMLSLSTKDPEQYEAAFIDKYSEYMTGGGPK